MIGCGSLVRKPVLTRPKRGEPWPPAASYSDLLPHLGRPSPRFGVLGERGDAKDLDLCARTLHPADARTVRPADQLSEKFFFFGASVPGFPRAFCRGEALASACR
jgi:hypothetical protein